MRTLCAGTRERVQDGYGRSGGIGDVLERYRRGGGRDALEALERLGGRECRMGMVEVVGLERYWRGAGRDTVEALERYRRGVGEVPERCPER